MKEYQTTISFPPPPSSGNKHQHQQQQKSIYEKKKRKNEYNLYESKVSIDERERENIFRCVAQRVLTQRASLSLRARG